MKMCAVCIFTYRSCINVSQSLFLSQGGQFLTDFAPLCRITCTDETEYTIYRWDKLVFLHTFHNYILLSWSVTWFFDVFFFFFFSCIRGRLLEVNENILETPNLLLEKVNVYFYTLCTSEYHVYVCPPVNIDYWLFMFACSYIWLKFTFIMIFVSFSTIIISVKSSNLIKRNAWNVIIVLHQSEQPSTEGYIAVILPKFEESKSITENLLSREEFESIVAKRTVDQSQPTWRSSMFLS